MKVKELIEELKKYNPEYRVLLYNHGRCPIEKQDEIKGCYLEKIYDDKDEVIEEVISLYEY